MDDEETSNYLDLGVGLSRKEAKALLADLRNAIKDEKEDRENEHR